MGCDFMRMVKNDGITFEIKEIDFISREEAMIWMLDNQLGRRNLSDAMKIEFALIKTTPKKIYIAFATLLVYVVFKKMQDIFF